MAKIRSLINKLGRFLTRRPKVPAVRKRPRSRETLGGGHRGIAAGNLKPGKQDLSAANLAKWRTLPASTVEAFVYESEWLPVHSTNVAALQYFFEDEILLVEFLDGKTYKYNNVSEDEAIQFAKASSKGGAVWDLLRVRGSKKAHKKPYQLVSRGYKPRGQTPKKIQAGEDFYEQTDEGGSTRYRLMDD